MADINGKIRLLRGTLASFAAGAFARCIRIITDSANGETLATWNGTEWIQMARQLADGSLKSQGLKVNGGDCIDASRNAQFATMKNEAITSGVFPVQSANGEVNSSLSEATADVKSTKPITLNGATRPAWSYWAVPIQLSNQSSIYTIAATGGDQVGFARNFYTAVDGFQKAIASYTGKGYPTQFHLDDNGRLRYFASQTDPVAGSTISDLAVRFEVNRFGGLGLYGVAAPVSRPTISGQRTATATLAALYQALGATGMILDATTGTSVTREAIIQPLPITNSAPGAVTVVSGGMKSFGFDGNTITEELFYHCDVQHDYIAGGDLIFHVHWMPATATGGDVKWQIEYQWVEAGATWPAPSTLTGTTAAGTTAWADKRTDFTISGAGHTYNSRIMIRLFRNPTDAADTYTGDAVLSSVGMHYQADPGQP